MKTVVISTLAVVVSALAISCAKQSSLSSVRESEPSTNQSASTLYYSGEATTIKPGGQVAKHPYIVARTTDLHAKTVVEYVIAFDDQSNAFAEYQSKLDVDGNHAFMTESTGIVKGEGDFIGQPWKWDFFKAEFKGVTLPPRIVDYNVFTPSTIMGHKDSYWMQAGVESLVQEEDIVLKLVDEAAFAAKKTELLKTK